MSDLSFLATTSKNKDRLVALLCLGVLEAVQGDVMNFDEAGRQLFWPAVWKELQAAGCSRSVLSLLQSAAELEDVRAMAPDTFDGSVEKVKRKAFAILRSTSAPAAGEAERWLNLGEGRPGRVPAPALGRMSGWEFEQWIANLLEGLGYIPTPTAFPSKEGLDLVAVKDGVKWGLEIKRYHTNRNVGAEAVHAFALALTRNQLQHGILVATTSFTSEAEEVARSKGIELWDGATLRRKLDEYQAVTRATHA